MARPARPAILTRVLPAARPGPQIASRVARPALGGALFDSAWDFDRPYPVAGDGARFEGWTTLALLAHHVPGRQIGHLVLGQGAGWHEAEARAYGLPFDPVPVRLRELEADLRVIRALLGREAGAWPAPGDGSSRGVDEVGEVGVDAPRCRLLHARNHPLPLTPGDPPIWPGTQGERVGMRLVATCADVWTHSGGPVEEFTGKLRALDRARRPSAIGRRSRSWSSGG